MKRRSENKLCFVLIVVFMAACIAEPLTALAQKLPFADSKGSPDATTPQKITLPATDEEIDKGIAQLESRITDFRRQSGTSGETGIGEKGGLLAAPPEELRKKGRLISELINILDRHAQVLRSLKELRKGHSDHTAEIKAWKGFAEKPPFSISFLDGLRDSLLAQKLDKQTLEVRLTIAKGNLQQYTKDLKESQKELRLSEEKLGQSRGKSDEARRLRLRDLAQLENSRNEAGAAMSEVQRLFLEEAIADKNEYIRFIDHKLTAAEAVSPLSKADLEQKLRDLDNQRKSLEEQLRQALKQDDQAREKLRQAREELDKAMGALKPGLTPEPKEMAKLSPLRSAVETRQVIAEGASGKVAVLKYLLQFTDVSQTLWEDRFELTRNPDLSWIRERYEHVQRVLAEIKLLKEFVQERLSIWAALIQSQRDKIESVDRTDAERSADRLILKTYEERQALLMWGSETLGRVERLANRLSDELAERRGHAPVQSRLKGLINDIHLFIRKIWNAELYVAEQTVIAEGNKIVRPVPVTVGKVIQALIILIAGTWVARRLMRLVRWIMIRRFKTDESTAQQIGTVSFLVLFLVVLAFSLISVNIPLAVFAFLGGALAIGLGFGAQNIINNFISSLILLFDRSIKAGDIVEIDGQAGRVVSIGLRSSHILGFDGVELLVPNSQFLQQKVTNWTLSVMRRRYSISVGVAYGSPTQEVSGLISGVVAANPSVLKDPAPVVLFEDFAESALLFSVYFWLGLASVMDNRIVLSEMRHRIAGVLEEAGITIAFPQRDVHLDAAKPIEVKVVS